MAELTQTEKDALIAKLKKFPYAVMVGTDNLGPLASPPSVADDVETQDVTLYETMGDVEAKFLTKNDLMLTVITRDVGTALSYHAAYKKGDNMIATAVKKLVTLVPITEATGEATITFANAFLQPGLKLNPGANGEPTSAELTYLCKADASTGKPFSYA